MNKSAFLRSPVIIVKVADMKSCAKLRFFAEEFDSKRCNAKLKAMEVHLTPDLERKLRDVAAQTGRGAEELAQEVLAGYLDELAAVRGTLDSRYDDLKSGRLKPIDGEEAFALLRQKSEDWRSGPA